MSIPVNVGCILTCPTVWQPVFGIFNVRADDACDFKHEGCTNTVRESALKADSGGKNLAAQGTRTRVSIAPDL